MASGTDVSSLVNAPNGRYCMNSVFGMEAEKLETLEENSDQLKNAKPPRISGMRHCTSSAWLASVSELVSNAQSLIHFYFMHTELTEHFNYM